MVKIAITCAVLLVLCQLAAARSFEEPKAAYEVGFNDGPNISCANTLAVTLRRFYDGFAGTVRQQLQHLVAERQECEGATGSESFICWARYRAQLIWAVTDLLEALRNRNERFEAYATILLEQYRACRVNDGDLFDAVENIIDDLEADSQLLINALNDIDCAVALKDEVVDFYNAVAARLTSRYVAARNIRRRCQLLSAGAELESCWWSYRIQVLLGFADTVRDVQERQANFDRTTLELLEAYRECRVQ